MQLYMILCGLFHLSAVIQSAAVKQNTGVISASVGDNVTLHCFYDSQVAMHFSWYRQTLGGGPELLTSIYKYDKPSKGFHWMEKQPRFYVQMKNGINHLHISDVHISDSATYFCGSSHSNRVEFGEGVFLSVKGASLKDVIQGPDSKIVPQGGSVTFDCTVHTGSCDGEHSVYWFRHESHQGILHIPEDRWEHVPSPGSPSPGSPSPGSPSPGSPSASCVYHLQNMNLTSSDAGTYYCAVASCGEILFGNGSKLFVQSKAEDQMAKMQILVWLSIIRTGILSLFVAVCLLVFVGKTKQSP